MAYCGGVGRPGGTAGVNAMAREFTWLAIILGFVMSLVGLVLGGVVKFVYLLLTFRYLSEGTIFDWFGLEIVSDIIFVSSGAIVHGVVAGMFSIITTSKILKNSDYKVVAYVLSTIVILFTAFSYYGMYGRYTPEMIEYFALGVTEILSITVGIIAGYFVAYFAVQEITLRQRQNIDDGKEG
jgi:hypothetical protein